MPGNGTGRAPAREKNGIGGYCVGDLVAEFLHGIGTRTAFGVVSVHNIPILDGIGRRGAIRFVPARGEAGAGHMADAYARVSGEIGVFVTSTGPGAANAAGALVEARFAGTPLLHVAGQTARPNLGRGQGTVHDVPDQLGMLASVSKAAHRVRDAAAAFDTLARAAAETLAPPAGPVSVEIPIDVQRERIERPAALDSLRLPLPKPSPGNPEGLDEIAARLRASRRPLLWTGNGARLAGTAVRRLVGLGVPLTTSWNGRGVVPEDDPLSLGPLATTGPGQRLLRQVDLLLVAGCRLRGHETADMSIELPEPLIQIDVDPGAEGRTYPSDLFHAADAGAALDAIADRLADGLSPDPGWAAALAAARAEAQEEVLAGVGAYRSFPGLLRAAMPRDAVWVRDVTLANSTWGNRVFPLYGPRDSVHPVGAGIGPGLPFGIGAALGAGGRKVVSMCGDGGFCLSLAELWTAVQEKADVVFLVMNDAGYGVIRHIQDSLYGGRHFYGDLLAPDFRDLSGLAGLRYGRISAAASAGDRIAEALAEPGPALVEVDMAAVGPFPSYFRPPPYAREE